MNTCRFNSYTAHFWFLPYFGDFEMSELSLRQKMILAQIQSAEQQMADLMKRLSQFDRLVLEMPEFASRESDMAWGGTLTIKREDLPRLRKVVGRLKVVRKNVPYDYDRVRELAIVVKPETSDFDQLSFCYRAPHKEGRCKVETQTSTYKTLVCSK